MGLRAFLVSRIECERSMRDTKQAVKLVISQLLQ